MGVLVCSLLMGLLFPITSGVDNNNVETEISSKSASDFAILSQVFAQGNGTYYMVGGRFIWGFGYCSFMAVYLDEDGYLEINPLSNNSESIILEGSHHFYMLGFLGFQSSRDRVLITGIALFTLWN